MTEQIFKGAWTPVFYSVTYNELVGTRGTWQVTGDYVDVEFFLEYDGLDITDASALQVSVPFAMKNADFITGEIYPFISTGLDLDDDDTVYFQGQGSDLKIRFVNVRGDGIAYNSIKKDGTTNQVKASGVIAGSARYRYKL